LATHPGRWRGAGAIRDDYLDRLRTLPCFDNFDQINAYAARSPADVVNPGVLPRARAWAS
jgi:hypothetical protein